MKLLFSSEDCLVGLVVGAVLLGLSGKYYTLPEWNILWGILFLVSLIFTFFDVFHTFSDLPGHMFLTILLFLTNIVDFIFEVALSVKYLGLNITLPFISQYMPLLEEPTVLFGLGVFFLASIVFWLIVTPFIS